MLALFVVGGAAAVVDNTADNRADQKSIAPAPPAGLRFDAVVGDCVRVDNADAADLTVVDCADRQAVYQVAVRRETSNQPCPAASYVAYTLRDTLLLCLVLNARPGECFDAKDARVDCAAPRASFRVEQVLEGTTNPMGCGEPHAANAIVYPEPELTLCRVPLP